MVIKVKYNGEWVKIPYLSSDNNPIIPEAPLDGKQYARQSGEWTVVNIPEVDFTEINQKISQNTAAIASNTTAIQSKVDKVDGFGLSSNDFTSQEKTKLAGLSNYALPTASDTIKGGIKVGSGLTMNGEVLSATGGGMADSVEWDNVLSKPEFATVATSGAYNDLTGRPSLATVATSGSYADLSNKPTIPTVDVTKSYVDTQLATKANASNVYTKAEVDSKVSSVYRVKGSVASYANLPSWIGSSKPTYTASEVGALASGGTAVNASKVANSFIFKVAGGSTEGTNLYTFNGSAAKTINVVAGSNVTLTPTAGQLSISAKDTTYAVATTSANGLMSSAMVTKLNGVATNANNYSLPTATGSVLGGVKTGSNITNSSGTISLSSGNVTSALGYTPVKNESGVASIRVMTQSAYDALSSKSATTLYIITG